jgi:ABC-2 type transport system ATP-binding protein
MAAAVEVADLVVVFGAVRAVDGVSLTAGPGGATALLGSNGAGKSTTLRVLAGVLPPTAGSVRVAGVDVVDDPYRAKRALGYCPDVGGLIPRATGWEHLQLAARLHRLPDGWQQRATDLLARFDLTAAADRVTAGYSHGMGRRLSVVLAAFHEPPVLLLDEPFDGVDPLGVAATLDLIAESRACGAAVLVSTHLLPLAVRACPDVVVLTSGRVVARIPAGDLHGTDGERRYAELLSTPAGEDVVA